MVGFYRALGGISYIVAGQADDIISSNDSY